MSDEHVQVGQKLRDTFCISKVYLTPHLKRLPLDVFIRIVKKPRRVSLEPGGKAVDYRYSDGKISLTLPRLDIRDIIVVE